MSPCGVSSRAFIHAEVSTQLICCQGTLNLRLVFILVVRRFHFCELKVGFVAWKQDRTVGNRERRQMFFSLYAPPIDYACRECGCIWVTSFLDELCPGQGWESSISSVLWRRKIWGEFYLLADFCTILVLHQQNVQKDSPCLPFTMASILGEKMDGIMYIKCGYLGPGR